MEQRTINPQNQLKKPLNLPLIMISLVVIIAILGGAFLYFSKNNESVQSKDLNNSFSEKQVEQNQGEQKTADSCDNFIDKLETCEQFSCEFEHPIAKALGLEDTIMKKQIFGLIKDGKCSYVEEMPNNGTMNCEYTESMRKAIVQYSKDIINNKSALYDIDGKKVENPVQESYDGGQCIISGYD